jgi:glycyl-tRNA synthetase
MANKKLLQDLMEFLQNKGFIWGPSPEIYGGMAGFYTYGPLGKLLKNNVEEFIRRKFQSENFWEMEAPIIQPKEVWEASGHMSSFTDPMIECSKCKLKFRADTLIEEVCPDLNFKEKDILDIIKDKNIKCPSCKSPFIMKVVKHSLMMPTTVGVNKEVFLRGETATTTYLPFKRYVEFFRNKVPFGVFQIGKAFRNEISPRQLMMRLREFTQAEAQLVVFAEDKDKYSGFDKFKDIKINAITKDDQKGDKLIASNWTIGKLYDKKYLKNKAYAYALGLTCSMFLDLGFPVEKIRLRQHTDDEKAFYADDAWDIEFKLNTFGWYEIVGVHDRTDYDLKQHTKFSKVNLDVLNEATGKREVPHIIEIAFGIDRPVFALLDMFYEKKSVDDGKNVFSIPVGIAPVKAAIFPLMKKPKLVKKATEVYEMLKKDYIVRYDTAGSIGKRYLREGESGTPFCITIDYDTIEKEPATVTVRDRDTEKQVRVKISKLNNFLYELVVGIKKV